MVIMGLYYKKRGAVISFLIFFLLLSCSAVDAGSSWSSSSPTTFRTIYSSGSSQFVFRPSTSRFIFVLRPGTSQPAIPRPEPKPDPEPEPKPEPDPELPKGTLSADEARLVQLVNQEREKQGLPALKVDRQVSEVARLKSQDMVDNNYFSHQSPTYGSPFQMLRNFGVGYVGAGENLAANSTVTGAHRALMNSSSHRSNILNSTWTHVGIGVAEGGPAGKIFTQIFIRR